jgi:hypothetical protein
MVSIGGMVLVSTDMVVEVSDDVEESEPLLQAVTRQAIARIAKNFFILRWFI